MQRALTKLGYVRDDFMQFIAKKAKRASPLMNRGYYARVKAIEITTHQFLQAKCSQPKQIVILGGGMGTLFFKLKQAGPYHPSTAPIPTLTLPLPHRPLPNTGMAPRRFIEVDFPEGEGSGMRDERSWVRGESEWGG